MVTPLANMPVAAKLAAYIVSRRSEQQTDAAIAVSKHCLLDFIGVALAGCNESSVRRLIEVDAIAGSTGPAAVVGHRRHTSLLQAALINGTMAHALDYDDVHPAMFGHPTAPIAPALFALCSITRVSGREFLNAFAVGVDVACLLGRYLGSSHYDMGYHATSTLGTVGASAGCLRLLGCNSTQIEHGLSLAATQAAGLKLMFGSMAKPLHAGRAAEAGTLAALLASRDFTGNPHVFDAKGGIAQLYSTAPSLERFFGAFDEAPFVTSVIFKHHVACFLAHAMIDGVQEFRNSHGSFEAQAVTVTVDHGHKSVCCIEQPRTGDQVKFSLKYLCAMALLGYELDRPETFGDNLLQDPIVREISSRVEIRFAQMNSYEARIEFLTSSGKRLVIDANSAQQSPLPLQEEKIRRKFIQLTSSLMDEGQARAICDHVINLETFDQVNLGTFPLPHLEQ